MMRNKSRESNKLMEQKLKLDSKFLRKTICGGDELWDKSMTLRGLGYDINIDKVILTSTLGYYLRLTCDELWK